jgi:hypothetical protein
MSSPPCSTYPSSPFLGITIVIGWVDVAILLVLISGNRGKSGIWWDSKIALTEPGYVLLSIRSSVGIVPQYTKSVTFRENPLLFGRKGIVVGTTAHKSRRKTLKSCQDGQTSNPA